MKIRQISVFLCAVFFLATALGRDLADQCDPASDANAGLRSYAVEKKTYAFALGFDLRNYKYEEPGFVEHNGLMFGLYAQLEANFSNSGTGYFETSLHYGKLTYKGALCDTGTGICSPYETSNQTDIISRTVGIYYLPMSGALSVGGGLGLRYLQDTVSEKGFYARIGTWGFLPIATKIDFPMAPNIRGLFELEYDYVFYGGIRSNLSQVSSSFEDVYMHQSGYGINLNFGAVIAGMLQTSLYYQTWNLNESDSVVSGGLQFVEPKNNSTSIGVKLGYKFQ